MKADIQSIKRIALKVKDNWSLCNFANNCEQEVMVAQTLHAAIINHDKLGEAFSFRGNGVFSTSGNGLVDNKTAYGKLLQKDFFREEERVIEGEKKVVIFPTVTLIQALDDYFAEKNK